MSSLIKKPKVAVKTEPAAHPAPRDPALSDAAKKLAAKTFISAYRARFQEQRWIGAPWWDLMVEWIAYARKRNWPVDDWMRVTRADEIGDKA